jgi:hypothetical protein
MSMTVSTTPEERFPALPNELTLRVAFLFIQDPRNRKDGFTGIQLLEEYKLKFSGETDLVDQQVLELGNKQNGSELVTQWLLDQTRNHPDMHGRQFRKSVAESLGTCEAAIGWKRRGGASFPDIQRLGDLFLEKLNPNLLADKNFQTRRKATRGHFHDLMFARYKAPADDLVDDWLSKHLSKESVRSIRSDQESFEVALKKHAGRGARQRAPAQSGMSELTVLKGKDY